MHYGGVIFPFLISVDIKWMLQRFLENNTEINAKSIRIPPSAWRSLVSFSLSSHQSRLKHKGFVRGVPPCAEFCSLMQWIKQYIHCLHNPQCWLSAAPEILMHNFGLIVNLVNIFYRGKVKWHCISLPAWELNLKAQCSTFSPGTSVEYNYN